MLACSQLSEQEHTVCLSNCSPFHNQLIKQLIIHSGGINDATFYEQFLKYNPKDH